MLPVGVSIDGGGRAAGVRHPSSSRLHPRTSTNCSHRASSLRHKLQAVAGDRESGEVSSPSREEVQVQAATSVREVADDDLAVHVTDTEKKTRNIVFVSSEAAPWSKTGGLGDVCGSLPQALAARGHRVMVVIPKYEDYEGVTFSGTTVDIFDNEVGYHLLQREGVDWVFLDHPSFPRPGGIYSDEYGVYGDNQFRFWLLCLAALEAPLQLELNGSVYGEDVVFLANDWHAALVPVYLAAKYRPAGVYKDARSVVAIHNIKHQGVFPPSSFGTLHLPGEWYGALEWQYPPEERQGSYEEEGRSVNTLKAGLSTADRILTVSPGYAGEIQSPMGGCGMEYIISSRAFVLNGIVNGIDMDVWNPIKDKHIVKNYGTDDFVKGKAANKVALQKELGLPQNENIPMVAFIGRLDFQKGADIMLQAAPWILQQDVHLVCLGTGDPNLENGLRWLDSFNNACGWVGFNVPLSHRITAAADILLMPSRFEPCGLNQLYAMRYGTVPIAHYTGGLKDTVQNFNPWDDAGTGWTFFPCDSSGLIQSVGNALQTYRGHRESFQDLQKRGMKRESSWDGAAQQYEQVFEWAKMDKPYC
ncbi:hypothetical protein BSKO_01870 [Bryopsis sp. KO-2023]|nr:hypothetical protein BSKO_01870 [Bryopsis sp. KO-2023]